MSRQFLTPRKMHILRCMGSKFNVKFQRAPLKFHTKFWTHTPQNMHFTVLYFCVWVTISLNCDVMGPSETGPRSARPWQWLNQMFGYQCSSSSLAAWMTRGWDLVLLLRIQRRVQVLPLLQHCSIKPYVWWRHNGARFNIYKYIFLFIAVQLSIVEPFSFIKTNVKVITGGLNQKSTSDEHNFSNKLILNVFIWHCSCYYSFNCFCFVLFVCVFVITSWWCKYKHAYFCLENLHFNNDNSNYPVLSSIIYLPVSYMWLLTWSKIKHTPFEIQQILFLKIKHLYFTSIIVTAGNLIETRKLLTHHSNLRFSYIYMHTIYTYWERAKTKDKKKKERKKKYTAIWLESLLTKEGPMVDVMFMHLPIV